MSDRLVFFLDASSWKYDTLEYSQVKAIAVSVRLRSKICGAKSRQHRPCPKPSWRAPEEAHPVGYLQKYPREKQRLTAMKI
jgi:hypothetical protein